MNGRRALFHHLQELFERQLRGLCRYSDIEVHVAIPVEKVPGKRRQALGKVREIVQAGFEDYVLTLESPHEAPPLGRATLNLKGGDMLVEGPIDVATFDRMGEAIKERKLERIEP